MRGLCWLKIRGRRYTSVAWGKKKNTSALLAVKCGYYFFYLPSATGTKIDSLRILYPSTAPIPSLSSNSQIHPFRQLTNARQYTLQWLHCLIYSVPLCEIRYLNVFTYECTFTWLTGYTVQYSVAGLHHSNCLTSVNRVFVSFTVWWCHWIPTMSTKEFRSHLQEKNSKSMPGQENNNVCGCWLNQQCCSIAWFSTT